MKTLWTMAGLAVSLTLGAETVLLDRTAPGGTSIDIALPERAVSDADRAVGEISLWITAGNGYTGWTWALPSRPDDLYLTDGAARSPLLNPTNPAWGDLGPMPPGARRELRFRLPPDARRLRLVCARGVFVWGGNAHGDFRTEIWKGVRAHVDGWVDAANRCGFVDMKDVPAERYVFTVAPLGVKGKKPRRIEQTSPVMRVRMPLDGTALAVAVEAYTARDGVFRQTLELRPHARPLAAPLEPGEIAVGHCVYDGDRRFADEIVTNGLCNLIVSWNKLDALTGMPSGVRAAFDRRGMKFMTIYGYDHRDATDPVRAALGPRYLWNNVGELAGYLYQGPKEAAAVGVPQDGGDLGAAKDRFVNVFMQRFVRNRHRDYGYVFSTSGSPLGCYELQGGMDFMCNELFAVGSANLAYATSEARGAARKWRPEFWGGWLAEEWQTFPVPYASAQKYDLLRTAMRQQYLMGTSLVVLESGAQTTQAQKYTAGADDVRQSYDDPAPRAYRRAVREFYDWTRAHPRDKSGPQVRAAFVMGNNDGFVGMCHPSFAIWGQHATAATNADWRCGAPEATWELVKETVFPLVEDALKPYPNNWLAATPFGQVDVVQVDDEVCRRDLARYDLLMYAGWNTMTPRILRVLADWVRRGGELVVCLPHFSVRTDRKSDGLGPADLINGGDLRELVPFKAEGRESEGVKAFTVGKGTVRLVTAWTYPGNRGRAADLYRREIEAALKRHPAAVTVAGEGARRISYAVYANTAYVLNMDCVRPQSVVLNLPNGRRESVTLAPCELRVVNLKADTARFADGLRPLAENPARGAAPGSWRRLAREGNAADSPRGFCSLLWELGAFSSRAGGADVPLTADALAAVSNTLARARANGATAIVRFAYTSGAARDTEPADFETLLGHVRQLGAVVGAFPETVLAVECGMVGPWGEMHSSAYLADRHKRELMTAWRAALGGRIPLLVRNPSFVLLAAAAGVKRLGMFNDGYLGTDGDYGTWMGGADGWTRTEGVDFLSSLCGVPYGGEFAYVSDEEAAKVSLFDPARCNLVEEWYRTHVSYLRNADDHSLAIPRRLAGLTLTHAYDFNGMPDLSEWYGRDLLSFFVAHLGYRFVIRGAKVLPKTRKVAVEIENTGFGHLPLPSKGVVAVDGREGAVELDLRSLGPGDKHCYALDWPRGVATKSPRTVALRLVADTPAAPLIRFANDALWDDEAQAFVLPDMIAAFNVRSAKILKKHMPDCRLHGLSLGSSSAERSIDTIIYTLMPALPENREPIGFHK